MSPDPGLTRGTLVYTRKTLFSVFFWVLWGDFCLQFMGVVVASVLPLLMTQWKAPAIFIGLFVSTIPALLNFLITPLVSVWSDRHRGKWGRRIPFLLVPTPFVVLFLLGIAGTEHVAHLVQWFVGGAWSFEACRMVVLGMMVVAFQIANMIVSSIYYYLFNDVVPEPRMGRFLGLFRIVSIAAAACFHFFVFSHADKHAPAIFAWSALLYGVGFGLMCLNVREGEYPEPEPLGARHPIKMAFMLLKECFSTPFFRTYALFNGAFTFAMAWNAFIQVMQVNVGLSYANIGMLMGGSFPALCRRHSRPPTSHGRTTPLPSPIRCRAAFGFDFLGHGLRCFGDHHRTERLPRSSHALAHVCFSQGALRTILWLARHDQRPLLNAWRARGRGPHVPDPMLVGRSGRLGICAGWNVAFPRPLPSPPRQFQPVVAITP